VPERVGIGCAADLQSHVGGVLVGSGTELACGIPWEQEPAVGGAVVFREWTVPESGVV
jgi:hypothetical protein